MLTKIFYYECKRILLGRLYLLMLIFNCIYALMWMWSDGIGGIGGTAPFSGWTFMEFCSHTLPPAILTVLLLQANLYSARQKKADILPQASPVPAGTWILLRLGVLAVCFLILCALEFAVFALPNLIFFGKTEVFGHILPGILQALPCFLLTTAIGTLLGSIHSGLVYGMAGAVFALGMIPFNLSYDLFCTGFFATYPLNLPVSADGEPAFCIVPAWLIARLVILALGCVLIWLRIRRHRKPDRA